MTDEELQALVAQNTQDIAGLKQTLGALITEVIRPLSEGNVELRRLTAELQNISRENTQRSVENAQLFRTLLAEAREDRINAQERFEAQQSAIRALLQKLDMSDEGTESM
ncbi:MAG: hypothetical protein AAFY33_02830 [Cyanobacteria bacterium J06643_4]